MSFRETEMARLLAFILEYCKRLHHPLLVVELLRKTRELYQKVPLYPGIIQSLLTKVIVADYDSPMLREGTIVIAEEEGKKIGGRIRAINDSGIILEKVSILVSKENHTINPANIVSIISEDVLEKDWPSLVFPDEEVSYEE
ncbi:hypothetical protein ACFL27_14890 [candidate division CSSED10-310 bacterium]|uniref:Uncharacterized protein n=1 Tax=candidate division CSSED10-310 bacterium TaxID=2855610 RepID=A0ABV6YZ54_UNCC1